MALRPLKVALILLVLPPVLFMLMLPALITPLANYLLQQKMQEVDAYLAERAGTLNNTIMAQLAGLRFDCSEQDLRLLRDPQHYNRYVRMIGIDTAQGGRCSTLGLAVGAVAADDVVPEGFSLSTTPRHGGTESELLVRYRRQGKTVFWVLDSSWSRELLATPCADCFYLSFRFSDPGISELHLERGNPAIAGEEEALVIRRAHQQQPIASQQALWGGAALRDHGHGVLWRWGGVGSLTLGGLLAAGYLFLRRYRYSLRGLIEKGIRDGEFMPYYQPVVDSRSRRIVGHEVLVRWQKGGDLIPPDQFIPAAESEGLVVAITLQLLQRVLDDLSRLEADQWVSINLVAEHVETDCLARWLQAQGWPWPDRITFELTERMPIRNLQNADKHISALIERGYQFKIDDFGIGYGGFAYLQQLKIEGIKIDKMFIDTIGTGDAKCKILDSIIVSAHQANMVVVAEGVETPEQLAYLAQRQVFLIQGYVFFRPMPIAEVLALPKLGQPKRNA